jgi:hypothetical protein
VQDIVARDPLISQGVEIKHLDLFRILWAYLKDLVAVYRHMFLPILIQVP